MFCLLVFLLVAVTKCSAQSSCITPSGSSGECKALRKCPPLLEIRNKVYLSGADSQLLNDSKCVMNSTRPINTRIRYVCCPNQRPDDYCVTPERELGKCVNISACDHLARMLDRLPVPVENIEYLKRSRCESSAPFSVCCQLKPNEVGTTAGPTETPTLSQSAGPRTSSEVVCSTPEGKPGRCINISSCDHIAGMLQKKPVPETTIAYVNRSICQGSTAFSVCCSEHVEDVMTINERAPSMAVEAGVLCVTPENKAGRCVNISACDHLVKMFENLPLSQKNYDYLKRSKCPGPYIFSVCCGPKPNDTKNRFDSMSVTPTPEGIVPLQATAITRAPSCEETNSAYPPDKNSGCCGRDSHLSTKIMGGNVTEIEEYPWLVLIKYDNPIPQTCGGSLISGKYVLTAAHCVSGRHLRGYKATHVIVGEYNRSKDGQDCIPVEAGAIDCTDGEMTVEIEKIILHPNGRDIALIRLKELVPYTFFYRPICLPTSDVTLSLPNSFRFIVAGWGVTDTMRVSDIKMAVEIPYVNITQCQSFLLTEWSKICSNSKSSDICQALRAKILQPHMVCAGGQEGKDSCSGDSGGPLMHENGITFEATGVLSVGPTPCAKANHPAMYVKVYDHLDWIRANIEPYVVVFLENLPYFLSWKIHLPMSNAICVVTNLEYSVTTLFKQINKIGMSVCNNKISTFY